MYVGRIITVGMSNGKPFIGYRVSSRSFPNRIAKIIDDKVQIWPLDEEDMKRNPYIAYNCYRKSDKNIVLSNGSHIDRGKIEDKQLTVLGKGKKERIVYLNSKALLAINNYLAERQDDESALFVSVDMPHARLSAGWVEKMCRDLGVKAGIENVHPHRFRRTGATMALRSGMPIEKVSYLLGHESIETTQIYLDIDETEVRRVHERYVV